MTKLRQCALLLVALLLLSSSVDAVSMRGLNRQHAMQNVVVQKSSADQGADATTTATAAAAAAAELDLGEAVVDEANLVDDAAANGDSVLLQLAESVDDEQQQGKGSLLDDDETEPMSTADPAAADALALVQTGENVDAAEGMMGNKYGLSVSVSSRSPFVRSTTSLCPHTTKKSHSARAT
jgi:hypothetical protein